MHNDEPALLDTLERGPLIEEVGEAIARCTPPQVFGVHGDWGLGKTSFLHQVQWYLTGDCPQQPEAVTDRMKKQAKDAGTDAPAQKCGVYKAVAQTVWFDAWRYQNEAAPVVALLHEMRAQLSWGRRAARATRQNAKVLVRGALLSMEGVTKRIGLQYSRFHRANREWETENLASALPSHTLREHLRAAVAQLLPRKLAGLPPPRLVVFIDDVDRCEPEAAYRLLEGLKIYLTLDNCVFVLGMNQKAIEEAIAQRMKSALGLGSVVRAERSIEEAVVQRMKSEADGHPKMRAAAYMEKLCQNVWRLPAVRKPEQVLCKLLEQTVEDDAVRDFIGRGLEVPSAEGATARSGHPCMPPNPRRLKGLANLIGRLSPRLPSHEAGLDEDEMVLEARLLLVVAYVYQFHHDLHVRWEADPGLYNVLHDWCLGTGAPLPFDNALELPLESAAGESRPSREMGTTYPDPTHAAVFWIQPLILYLGNEMESQRFERYLHGVPS